MSSKVTSTQVAQVSAGKAGQQEVGLWIATIQAYGGPKLGVSVEGASVWLRFSHTSDALAKALRDSGWHYSEARRKGWHRADNPQAHKFMAEVLGVTREGTLVSKAAPKAAKPAKQESKPKDTPAQESKPAGMADLSDAALIRLYAQVHGELVKRGMAK